MPIATGLRAVLDGVLTPAQAGQLLMSRRLKAERE
jgi:hypothetical protein